MNKRSARIRRGKRSRMKMRELGVTRLSVFRSSKHIYAQVISGEENKVAERAKEKGIESVAFDRSGFKYHGRVKALAEAAREAGLQF